MGRRLLFRRVGNRWLWDGRLERYAVVAAMRETADAAAVVATLAATRDVGTS